MAPSPSDELQLVKRCCNLAFKAHGSGSDFVKDNSGKPDTVFVFRPWESVDDWFSGDKFSKSKPDRAYFPSLKVLGSNADGILNKAFQKRFRQIVESSQLQNEIEMSLSLKESGCKLSCCLNNQAGRARNKQIVFTGHSNGGAIAILMTIWFLENQYRREPKPEVLCITFGSPLVGDKIVGHAIRREGWSSCFKNFVLPPDPIPRIHFSPREVIAGHLPTILQSWSPPRESISGASFSAAAATNQLSEELFNIIVNSTFSIASYDSCVLRSSAGGSSLLEAVKGIVDLSPYRPFGSFYFCCSEGKVVKVENHDAVMQLLFYSLLLERSSSGSNGYQAYEIKTIVPLDNLSAIRLSVNDQDDVNSASKILDLDIEARLNLRAAGEMENARKKNLATVKGYKNDILACLSKLQMYCTNCEEGIGYYDAFKLQQNKADFEANVTRLELVAHWDEIRELLKVSELPDSFEVDREWVELGTTFRLLVEPIDIANFYRHDKNEETDFYKTDARARPNYYKYPQNWLQHMRRLVPENDPLRKKEWNLDSCFWARVENMCIGIKKKGFDSEKQTVLGFEKEVEKWLTDGVLTERELKRPTFQKWWGMLPEQHKINSSCIPDRMVQLTPSADPTVSS